MNEKLNQIGKNHSWELVPRPHDKNIIGTKMGVQKQTEWKWRSNFKQRKTCKQGLFLTGRDRFWRNNCTCS